MKRSSKPNGTALVGAGLLSFIAFCWASGGVGNLVSGLNLGSGFFIGSSASGTSSAGGAKAPAPLPADPALYQPASSVIGAPRTQAQGEDREHRIVLLPEGAAPGSTPGASSANEREASIMTHIKAVQGVLTRGLTREEVQSSLQVPLVAATDHGDLEHVRDDAAYSTYDYFAEPGYPGAAELPDPAVDETGLLEERVGARLFISWRNNRLQSYSIAYVHPAHKKVYLLRLHPDGTVTDTPVSP